MALFHPSKVNPFSHYSYDPLLPTSHMASLHYLPPLNPSSSRFITSHISSKSLNFTSSPPTTLRRRLPVVFVSAPSENPSSEQPLEIHTQISRILAIITFIWRLPSFIARFFEKEEKFLDTVEEDIIEAADIIKVGAKVAEELAEGLEEVAEGIEKAAKTIDKDAKKVDDIMDKVKEKTKVAHDELEEVVGTLEGSLKGTEKDSAKVEIGSEGLKALKATEEDITNDTNMVKSPPRTINPSNSSAKTSNYEPFEYPTLLWRSQSLMHSFLDSLQWPLFHVHFQSLFDFMPLHRVILRSMLMVSFLFFIGAVSSTSLASYVF